MDIRKAIANQHHPFVQMSRQSALSDKAAAAFEQCLQHFNLFHVLNYAMYEEYLKVSDMVDELGLRKFQVKKRMKACDQEYNRYTDIVHAHQSKETWYLMQDYGRLFYESIEPKITFLYVAVDNLLNKLHFSRAQLLSRSMCVVYLLDIISNTWSLFFETYRKLSGLDFSSEFQYASMAEFRRNYEEAHMALTSPNFHLLDHLPGKALYIIDDPACKNAVTALRNAIDDTDAIDRAAYQAIMYSDTIRKEYEEDMKRIKEEKQKEEMGNIEELLSQKYKVSRL